jgi:hypothetical protein
MNGARPRDDQDTVVFAAQNVANLIADAADRVGSAIGHRKLFLEEKRGQKNFRPCNT